VFFFFNREIGTLEKSKYNYHSLGFMPEFNGISEAIFDSCVPSEKIRIPINMLKELQAVIEPELKKINPMINGHVSRVKKRASNEYRDWAWLYFNTQPREAWRYSQLTINISPNRLFVGVDIRTPKEYQIYRKEISKLENCRQVETTVKLLSTRELFVATQDDDWETAPARKHSVEELRGILLTPNLFWINIPFEKGDPILRQKSFASNVIQIFSDLYNIFAFATGNKTISREPPKLSTFVPDVVVEAIDSIVESDETDEKKVKEFLGSLKGTPFMHGYHLPGKSDQYFVQRKALEYNLKPFRLQIKGVPVVVYSDHDVTTESQIFEDYEAFVQQMDNISKLFSLTKGFLKIMFVNTATDARYSQTADGYSIFVNIAAFHARRSLFFWLFTIARELAYIKNHRIGYPFLKDMRRLIVHALSRLQFSSL